MAHSKKVIRLCNKYGIVKQATSGNTPHSIMLLWKDGFKRMVRCQLSQINVEEESWENVR